MTILLSLCPAPGIPTLAAEEETARSEKQALQNHFPTCEIRWDERGSPGKSRTRWDCTCRATYMPWTGKWRAAAIRLHFQYRSIQCTAWPGSRRRRLRSTAIVRRWHRSNLVHGSGKAVSRCKTRFSTSFNDSYEEFSVDAPQAPRRLAQRSVRHRNHESEPMKNRSSFPHVF